MTTTIPIPDEALDPYAAWLDGYATPREALNALAPHLAEALYVADLESYPDPPADPRKGVRRRPELDRCRLCDVAIDNRTAKPRCCAPHGPARPAADHEGDAPCSS